MAPANLDRAGFNCFRILILMLVALIVGATDVGTILLIGPTRRLPVGSGEEASYRRKTASILETDVPLDVWST